MYIKEEISQEIVVEKSRFICCMKHVKDEQAFREYLSSIRKKYYDASHVCGAFICGNTKRSNDDGEPAGTAGAPILNVLEKNKLNETCAIVVRYFGGIKLGAGGLIRAYGNAVSQTLHNAILAEDFEYPLYRLCLSYETANKVEYYLRNSTILIDSEYSEHICYIFALDDEHKIDKILEFTKGIKPVFCGVKTIEKVIELNK